MHLSCAKAGPLFATHHEISSEPSSLLVLSYKVELYSILTQQILACISNCVMAAHHSSVAYRLSNPQEGIKCLLKKQL